MNYSVRLDAGFLEQAAYPRLVQHLQAPRRG
jgi:hypothetical protein